MSDTLSIGDKIKIDLGEGRDAFDLPFLDTLEELEAICKEKDGDHDTFAAIQAYILESAHVQLSLGEARNLLMQLRKLDAVKKKQWFADMGELCGSPASTGG